MRVGRRELQIVLALAGLAVALYLTLYHYEGVPLACSTNGIINCSSVLNSKYAYVFGVPIAVYGVIFFVVELGLLAFGNADALLLWAIAGLGSVFFFIYIEYLVGHICEWCTSVHGIVLVLFIISLYEVARGSKKDAMH